MEVLIVIKKVVGAGIGSYCRRLILLAKFGYVK